MSAKTFNIDELLRSAARPFDSGSAPAEDAESISPAEWDMLEDYLQARSERLAAGEEAPGLPKPLAQAMLENPELRAAFAALAQPCAQAAAQALPAAEALPAGFRLFDEQAQAPDEPAAASAEDEPTLQARVSAVLHCAMQKWAAVSVFGLELVQAEMVLARGTASAPIAMQGRLGDYLLALSLAGDDPQSGGVVLDAQCQVLRPGETAPRSVPSFCLRSADGSRHHSRDRVARVEGLGYGRHVFQLEVTGRKQGEISLSLEDGQNPGPGEN